MMGNNMRLAVSMLTIAILFGARWYLGNPLEAAGFIDEPLLGLADSPILPIVTAMVALMGLAVLMERAKLLFLSHSWTPALAIASLAVVAAPFHQVSGLLFGIVLIAGSAVWSLSTNPNAATLLATPDGVRGIFFVSGMAALVYQVAWQKKLISLLGADGQSVTVIIAVFLGGLGVGALVGGKVGHALGSRRCIAAFCAIELVAGIFGAASMYWLEWIGGLAAGSFSPAIMIAAAAGAIGFPTVLMGMTLPILVEGLKGRGSILHENIGKLYALNALGSAVASLLAATMVFRFTGLIGATWIAATLNVLTAFLVLVAARHWARSEERGGSNLCETELPQGHARQSPLSWPYAAVLVGLTGFITISQEVLLLRMMSWSSGGAPWTFGFGVGAFLLGLGFGSLRVSRLEVVGLLAENNRVWTGTALVTLVMPALAALVGGITVPAIGTLGLAVTMGLIGFLGGSSLPMVAGQVRPDEVGNSHFGAVYSVNIAGSVAGAIVTGYFLFDVLTTDQCIAVCAALSMLTGGIFMWLTRQDKSDWRRRSLAIAGLVLFGLPMHGALYERWREWLYQGTPQGMRFADTMETRAGIIAVQPDQEGDIVIGGGAYDGRFNVDPTIGSNLIFRPYVAMALLPQPDKILQIGLGSGSWTKAILSFPALRELKVIDINAGYQRIIADNPIVSDILVDPRADFVVADARKWLQAGNDQWSMIIVNNTYYWREGATLLHSREFMELARRHLAPNGILFLNTTGAQSIDATALSVFPEAYRIGNGIAAINGHLAARDIVVLGRRLAQSAIFSAHGLDEAKSRNWISQNLPVLLDRRRYAKCNILTDDAMATEWGKSTCQPTT